MNDLRFTTVCNLLCCPPFPSKIAAKLAFMPPPISYSTSTSDEIDSISFTSQFKGGYAYIPWDRVHLSNGVTKRRNKIVIAYMNINNESKLTFLISHGNAVDLGLMLNFMYELGTKLNVNILCYDYSGYGASSGKPLEKNLYADAECAIEVLRSKYLVPLDHIVLYGQSIGTVPTVFLATTYKVAGVVLHSPLSSGLRMAFPRLKYNCCCDVLSNHARASRIQSPTLVIHGTDDEVIHSIHAQQLLELIPNPLTPLFIVGAGHNNCELYEEYLIRLEYMVYVELGFSDLRRPDIASSSLDVWSRDHNWSIGQYFRNRNWLKALDERLGAMNTGTTTSSTNTLDAVDTTETSTQGSLLPNILVVTTTSKTEKEKCGDNQRSGPSKRLHKCNTVHVAQKDSGGSVGLSNHVSETVSLPNHNVTV